MFTKKLLLLALITLPLISQAQNSKNFDSFNRWTLTLPTAANLTGATVVGIQNGVSTQIPASVFQAINPAGSAASLSISGQSGLLSFTGLTSTNRIKTVRDAADTFLELGGSYTPSGTWTSMTLVTPALGTPASGNLANCTFPSAIQTGGWTYLKVVTSAATTTGQSLVDITGLVSGTLTNSATYEIEAVLNVTNSADTNGQEFGIGAGGTGSAAVVNVILTGTTTTTAATAQTINAVATASSAMNSTSAATGTIIIKGFVTTRSTGTATISVTHLKPTSGTSSVNVGSVLRYRVI